MHKGRRCRHIKDVRNQYEWLTSAGMVWKTAMGQIKTFDDREVKQLKMPLPWKVWMSRGIAQDQFHSIPTSTGIKMAGGTAKNKAVLCVGSHRCLKVAMREHVFPSAGPGMAETGY